MTIGAYVLRDLKLVVFRIRSANHKFTGYKFID